MKSIVSIGDKSCVVPRFPVLADEKHVFNKNNFIIIAVMLPKYYLRGVLKSFTAITAAKANEQEYFCNGISLVR